MAFSVKAGTFAARTTNGDQVVTGVGFQPKALLLWGSRGANGFGTTAQTAFGMAVSSSSRAAICGVSRENVTTMDTRRGHENAACFVMLSSEAASYLAEADFVSFDSDGFTINWSTTDGLSRIINYIALGGADLTNVAIKEFTSKTSTGTESYTGVGFQPDCIIFMSTANITAPGSIVDHNITALGWAISSSEQGVSGTGSRDNLSDSISNRIQLSDHCMALPYNDTVIMSASLDSMDSDGFTLDYDAETAAGARYVWALCLKGGSYACGAATQKTSTGTEATTGIGFQPTGLLLQSVGMTASASISASHKHGLGAASGTTARNNYWASDSDAAAVSATDKYQDDSSCLTMADNTPAIQAQADLDSFDADGFTLDWTTADATSREFLYLAFGDTAVVGGQPTMRRWGGIHGMRMGNRIAGRSW